MRDPRLAFQRAAGADSPGSRDVISYAAACRSLQVERVTIAVKRVSGAGPFNLRLSYAG